MRKALFLLLLLWVGAVMAPAQNDDQPFKLREFKGLNRAINELNLSIGAAKTSLNWDFSKKFGALPKRDGFTAFQIGLSSVQVDGWWSGLYAYNRTDGQKRLFASFNPDSGGTTWKSTPYQLLVRSLVSDNNLVSTSAYPWQYYGASPKWTTYQNIVVHANGFNRPLRFNGVSTEHLTEVQPGHFDFAPMKDTGGSASTQQLDGEYYYVWKMTEPTASLRLGGPSWRIDVNNDWVVLLNPPHAGSTEDTTLPSSGAGEVDTIVVQISRTRAGAAWLDSTWLIGTWTYIDTAANPYFIDSLPDESLGVGTHSFSGILDTGITVFTQDTTASNDYYLGQIQWLGTDTCLDGTRCVWAGISEGLQRADSTWSATHYNVRWYDSSTGAVSQPGPLARIPVAYLAGDSIRDQAIRLALPPIDSSKDHLWRLIYRAREDSTVTKTADTTFSSDDSPAIFVSPGGSPRDPVPAGFYCIEADGRPDRTHSRRYQKSDGSYWCKDSPWTVKDTVAVKYELGTFRLIDTIKIDTQTTYSDSLSWVDFLLKPAEPTDGPPYKQFIDPTIVNDRLYMGLGSQVFYSETSIIGDIRSLNAFDVNIDDGDEITAIHDYEGIVLFKNNSLLWGQEQDFILHNVEKIQTFNRIGCVAPRSVINLPGGGFAWLHTSGIYKFQSHIQSEFKEAGGFLPPKISEPIQNNLDAYDIVHLRECHSWLTGDDKNLVFSFPTLDTSFVLNLATGQWGQWTGLVAQQTTRYDTTVNTQIRPSTQVLFTRWNATYIAAENRFTVAANDTVFALGGSKQDNGDSVQSIWESGPMFQHHGDGQLLRFGMWKEKFADTNEVVVEFFDENEVSVYSKNDSVHFRHKTYDVNAIPSKYITTRITTKADSLIVEGFDWWYKLINDGKDE
jgi:hypothetical protein